MQRRGKAKKRPSGTKPDELALKRTERGLRHRLGALKARIKARGLSAIDMRTIAAKSLMRWKGELIAALGGEDEISPQERGLIELAVRLRLYVDDADAGILAMPSIINNSRRSIFPIVLNRNAMAAELRATLKDLGLQRRAKTISAGFTVPWATTPEDKDAKPENSNRSAAANPEEPGKTQDS